MGCPYDLAENEHVIGVMIPLEIACVDCISMRNLGGIAAAAAVAAAAARAAAAAAMLLRKQIIPVRE
jgi:uncharacterized membrane protein